MLVVILVFTHKTVERENWLADITVMQVFEGHRFQGGYLMTKITSATSLPIGAVTFSHTVDLMSGFSRSLIFAALSLTELSDPLYFKKAKSFMA